MRRRGIVLGLLCLAAVVPTTAPATARTRVKKCARVDYSAGNGYYFYASTRIRARGVKCSLARTVARVKPDNGGHRYRSHAFTCRAARKSTSVVAFTCTRKKARITFAWTTK